MSSTPTVTAPLTCRAPASVTFPALSPELYPNPMLPKPVTSFKEFLPIAVLPSVVVTAAKALLPKAVFAPPEDIAVPALSPIAVFNLQKLKHLKQLYLHQYYL